MAANEASMYGKTIVETVDRIVNCLSGLSDEQISQRPPVPEANSLLVLAVHTMENVEECVFEVLGGENVSRDRESEFRTTGRSAEDVQAEWAKRKERVTQFLNSTSQDTLDRTYDHHRWGQRSGRAVLLRAAVHAGEHAGHAELTRDWLKSHQ